jgi:hypothetical protein
MYATLSFVVTACVALPFAGCSGDSSREETTAGDGGSSPRLGRGSVLIQQYDHGVSGELTTFSVQASFYKEPEYSGCKESDVGSCHITDCRSLDPDGGPPYEFVSAGVIQVTGAGEPISLIPNGSGPYTAVWEEEPRLAGGETLTLSAAGDVIPAFQGSLLGVTPVTLTSPALPASGNLAVSTKADFNFTWTGGTGGIVSATLMRDSGADRLEITCSFPDTAGSGAIPASALAAIAPGSNGSFVLQGGDMETLDVSGWAVSLVLQIPARRPATAKVTFE